MRDKDRSMINLEKLTTTLTHKGNNQRVGFLEVPHQARTIMLIRGRNTNKNENSSNRREISMRTTKLKMISITSTQGTIKERRKLRTTLRISSKGSGISHLEEGLPALINSGSTTIRMRISIALELQVPSEIIKEGLLIQKVIKITKIMASSIAVHNTALKRTLRIVRMGIIQTRVIKKPQKKKPKKMNSIDSIITRTTRRKQVKINHSNRAPKVIRIGTALRHGG